MSQIFHPVPKMKKFKGQVFPGQFPDEKLVFLVRRHWSAIFKYIVILFFSHVLAIALFVFLYFVFSWNIPQEGPMYIILVMFVSSYFLGIWLLYLHAFVDYHLDIWILTDKRVLNIQQDGLFKRTVSELDVLRIQDVTVEINGKMQTLFNFGNVYIQTAAQQQRFIFEEVDHPQEVAQQIIKAVEDANRANIYQQAVNLQQQFSEPQKNKEEVQREVLNETKNITKERSFKLR